MADLFSWGRFTVGLWCIGITYGIYNLIIIYNRGNLWSKVGNCKLIDEKQTSQI